MNSQLRVLFIEDSPDDVLLLERELRKSGYDIISEQVETADTLRKALKPGAWDVIIADYVIPGFGAPSALAIVQDLGLDIPFIVVSRVVGEEVAVSMMRAGAHDYLLKDHLKRLTPAIERELREVNIRRQKYQAENQLQHTLAELESLVQQRTAELQQVNAALQVEIEERIRAEKSLSHWAAIVQSSEDAIISTDLEGRVLSWNPGAENLYGYSVSEALGQPLDTLLYPELARTWDTLSGTGLAEGINHRQTLHKRKDGDLIDVSMTVSPIQDAQGKLLGLSMIVTDIRDRRAIERIKDELISIVSHEFRTPVTSLQASIELLLTQKFGQLTPQGHQLLEIAANNLDRLSGLMNNILDLEQLAAGAITLHKQIVNVSDLVHQAVQNVKTEAHAAGISLCIQESTASTLADPKRIVQVLTNLIGNAIKFSAPGDRIWLSAELKNDPPDCHPHSSCTTAPYILLSVRDEGTGIPSHCLETIFDHFHQVDTSDSRRYNGAGLGLSVCRSIMRHHQGKLWVESTLGQGSTFYLTLPVASGCLDPVPTSNAIREIICGT